MRPAVIYQRQATIKQNKNNQSSKQGMKLGFEPKVWNWANARTLMPACQVIWQWHVPWLIFINIAIHNVFL